MINHDTINPSLLQQATTHGTGRSRSYNQDICMLHFGFLNFSTFCQTPSIHCYNISSYRSDRGQVRVTFNLQSLVFNAAKLHYFFQTCKHFTIFLLSSLSSQRTLNAPADKKISRRPAIPKHRNNRWRAAIICLHPPPAGRPWRGEYFFASFFVSKKVRESLSQDGRDVFAALSSMNHKVTGSDRGQVRVTFYALLLVCRFLHPYAIS